MATEEIWRNVIGFFSIDILALYRNQSHKYEVSTDYFEGRIHIRSDPYQALPESDRTSSYVDVQFGFRRLANGELAVAAYLPDLEKCFDSERNKWLGLHLKDAEFSSEPDPRFEQYIQRYLAGDWGVDNGVLFQISDEVANLNAITRIALGEPLFALDRSTSLIFPTAENTHAYQNAHKAVYGYLVDGLRKEAIKALAERLGHPVQVESDKTLKALRKVLPPNLQDQVLDPFEIVSGQRRQDAHGVPPPSLPFGAFNQFSKDMEKILKSLRLLKGFMENRLKVKAQSCRVRESKLAMLPEIDPKRKPEPNYSISELPAVEGKTIQRVEFGFRKQIEGVHGTEVIILHFTDGTILGIDTGWNVGNLALEYKDIKAEDFHVRFSLTLVPSI